MPSRFAALTAYHSSSVLADSLTIRYESRDQRFDLSAGCVDAEIIPSFRSPGDTCRQFMFLARFLSICRIRRSISASVKLSCSAARS